MKKKKIKIPIYNIDMTVVEVENKNDADAVCKEVKYVCREIEYIDTIRRTIENEEHDGGEAIRNLLLRKILVVIYKCSSEKKRREIIGHEKRHIEDRILEFFNINDIESAAMLAGFLSSEFY